MSRFLCLLMALALAAPASAQQAPKWEIEGYGGVAVGQAASAGSLSLPPAGAPIVTSTPTFPSRETPSWLFGDGSVLVNGAMANFGLTNRIAPLDAAFGPLPFPKGPAFGARLRRVVNPRASFEVSVDALARSVDDDEVAAAIEAARASFAPAFTELFASGPFSNVNVGATASIDGGSYRETALTAGLSTDVARLGSFVPYVTFGAGVIFGSGTLPSATLDGRYRASILGQVPLDESDHVEVRFSRGTALTAVVGGGLRRDLGARWSLRADVRVFVAQDTTRVRVDARPTNVRGTPAGFIELFTNPALQFSNEPATGRRSSLSAAPLDDVDVFKGGVLARTSIGVAVSRRF